MTVRVRVAMSASFLSAISISSALRMIPTSSCMVFCSSRCTTNGFSPPSVALENGSNARSTAAVRSASVIAGLVPMASTYCAAPSPHRLPNTSRSDSELPPSRLLPCIPPEHSPAANRPGTVDMPVSGSTSIPPIT